MTACAAMMVRMRYNGRGISSGLFGRRLALMEQRYLRLLIRDHTFAFLSGFVSLSLNALGLWLQFTGWGRDVSRAFGVVGYTCLLPLIWTVLYRRSAQTSQMDGARQEGASSARAMPGEIRPSARVRRGAYVAWGALLLLGFAQVVLVISSDWDLAWVFTLAGTILNFFGLVGVFLVGLPLVRRQQ